MILKNLTVTNAAVSFAALVVKSISKTNEQLNPAK